KPCLNLLRDRTTSACADRNAVDRANRRDFRGCSGEEKLVSHVQCRTLNRPFFDRNAELLADLNHAVASDTWEYRGRKWRRQHDVAGDEEDILTGTFRNVATIVERDTFGESIQQRFHL